LVISALLAINVQKPVKVILTREDEFLLSHPRSLSVQKLLAKSNAQGELVGLRQEISCGWIKWDDMGLVSPIENGIPNADLPDVQLFSATGSDNWYDVPNKNVKMYRNKTIEAVTGNRAVRSVANNYTVFALESFIDEFAALKKIDPVDLRLSLLKGKQLNSGKEAESLFPKGLVPYVNVSKGAHQSSVDGGRRLANVLRTATGLANYGGVLAPGVAQGVAVAGAEERTNPSFSACVADVEANIEAKFFEVRKLTIAIDLGLIVNPDGALAQIEGSVLWGLSNGLYEELTYENGKVQQTNFDTYKWQTVTGMPEINIKLLENSNYPSGAGEPATSIIAPAICNAIHAASRIRIRELPVSRERFAAAVDNMSGND
jgi:CO/xanthine dehydrogenase Mo-binding subunit